MDIQIQRAADVFDLKTAIANITDLESAVAGFAKDLLRWLTLHKVNERSFHEFIRLGCGLAYPNEDGIRIRTSIVQADDDLRQKKVPGMVQLVASASLGRVIVLEPDFCYMATTVACLASYHNLDYAQNALTSMILDSITDHEENIKYQHHVMRAPIKVVVARIVDSIYLNVVNAGHYSFSLPQELRDLHPHLIDDTTFAAIIIQIQREKGDILLKSDFFLGDVALWILAHFNGLITIAVDSKILYEKKLGKITRVLTWTVLHKCSLEGTGCEGQEGSINLAEISKDGPRVVLRATMDPTATRCSILRHSLYTMVDRLAGPNPPLPGVIRTKLKLLSREMAALNHLSASICKWIFTTPIGKVVKPNCSDLRFASLRKAKEPIEASDATLGDLFMYRPTLSDFLRSDSGADDSYAPDEYIVQEEGCDCNHAMESPFLIQFDQLRVFMDDLATRCQCDVCLSPGYELSTKKVWSGFCRRCLPCEALTRIYVYVSHAIAEAMGATDTSSRADYEGMIHQLDAVLGRIQAGHSIQWNSLFRLAAIVVTGCQATWFNDNSMAMGMQSIIAVQHGSLVLLSSHCSSLRKFSIIGSFSFQTFTGNISGIADDFAILETEPGYDGSSRSVEKDASIMAIDSAKLWDEVTLDDDSLCEIKHGFVHVGGYFFRLITIIISGKSLRIIDPVMIPIVLGLSKKVPACSHKSDFQTKAQMTVVELCSLQGILSHWRVSSRLECLEPKHVTKRIRTSQELGIAIACAYPGAALWDGSACPRCALNCAYLYGLDYIICYQTSTPEHRSADSGTSPKDRYSPGHLSDDVVEVIDLGWSSPRYTYIDDEDEDEDEDDKEPTFEVFDVSIDDSLPTLA